jgi:hypothetical protein
MIERVVRVFDVDIENPLAVAEGTEVVLVDLGGRRILPARVALTRPMSR